MKFFVDLSKKQLIKSAASNVALERLVLKRRDSLAVEVVFVSRNAPATMPGGTTVSVALKKSFSDSNFLASASGTPPILNLNTVPLEALFTATAPSAIPALLEVRWTVPGETTRTATLTAEVQNSVILGTEATPEAIPDGKATQAQAEAGTNNEKWMTPLRTAQAIAVLAPPPTWDAVQNKPATFPPSAHTHAISEVTGLQTALDSKATTTALTAETTARTTALSTKADLVSGKVPASQLTTFTYGQPGIVPNSFGADAGKFLKGDGNWTLPTTSDVVGLDTALAGKQPTGSYATLVSGKVPADQLPSYVDDVLEFANLAALPVTGETGKIYVTLDTRRAYRWTGSQYLEISPSEVTSVAGKTGAVTLATSDIASASVYFDIADSHPSVNGSYDVWDIDANGRFRWANLNAAAEGATWTALRWNANRWELGTYTAFTTWTALYFNPSTAVIPPATGWQAVPGNTQPIPTLQWFSQPTADEITSLHAEDSRLQKQIDDQGGINTAAIQTLSTETAAALTLKADLVNGLVPTTQLPPISFQSTRYDGDGTAFTFAPPGTLTNSDSPSALSVTINGVTQEPGSDYTLNVATNRVVLTSALPLGDKIVITRPILLPSNSTLTAEQLGALTATSTIDGGSF